MAVSKEKVIKIGLKRYLDLSDDGLASRLAEAAEVWQVKARDIIRRPGADRPYLMCIVSGVVRGYYLAEHGRCFTVFFADAAGDPFWVPGLKSMEHCGFDALTDGEILTIPWSVFWDALGEGHDLEKIRIHFLERRVHDLFQHRLLFQVHRATQRYLLFLEEYPGLETRINDEYIADYLGITNVSLSRIRTSINKRKKGR